VGVEVVPDEASDTVAVQLELELTMTGLCTHSTLTDVARLVMASANVPELGK
jgi:hypothetical protein